ncbi:hypothetical protein [Gemmobacter serpentinus]|uniref:hypothetical protein n=1 Tax=Gemmobacter serpentinus TaxID=2652247 RepID=UPI0018657CDB|nr:hypothetical protein [Gemmobacter serpentinus]
MEDMIYVLAGLVPMVTGISIGKRHGVLPGIGAGIAAFVVVVLIMVGLGFGY